mmetsp:Transcript_2833/g.11586  ORF Transcript_2833/g.11586 Transcript_2833/m.11586 type:complete len:236 (+) Transcript_2833:552-1259(+)
MPSGGHPPDGRRDPGGGRREVPGQGHGAQSGGGGTRAAGLRGCADVPRERVQTAETRAGSGRRAAAGLEARRRSPRRGRPGEAAVVGGEAAGRGEAKGHESSAVGMGRAGRWRRDGRGGRRGRRGGAPGRAHGPDRPVSHHGGDVLAQTKRMAGREEPLRVGGCDVRIPRCRVRGAVAGPARQRPVRGATPDSREAAPVATSGPLGEQAEGNRQRRVWVHVPPPGAHPALERALR